MTQKPKILKKWIALNDPEGAKLKLGRYNNKLILVITGARPRSHNFNQAIKTLGFIASGTGAYLVKAVEITDRINPAMFRHIWPRAALEMMNPADYTLDLASMKQRLEKKRAEKEKQNNQTQADAEQQELQESVSDLLGRSKYLGRNPKGLRVYGGVTGRFTISDEDEVVYEPSPTSGPMFLRGATQSDIRECAKGLLRATEMGESHNLNRLLEFAGAVLDKDVDALTEEDRQLVAQAIDSALLESFVEEHETAGQAWADAAYYQEMMPGRVDFAPDSAACPYLPAPLAIQVQRFLSSANAVTVNGKIPGFGFGMLPDSTRVFVEDPDTLEWGSQTFHRPMVEHSIEQDIPADGGYWRISGQPTQEQFSEFFDSLDNEAIAIITSGEQDHLDSLKKHAHLIQSIKVPTWLSGTSKPIFLNVFKKGELPHYIDPENERATAPITSWEDLKAIVDEALLRMGQEAAANERVESLSVRMENQLQRPYLAASKVGEASTMVPRNLQSALGFALSRLQENNGPIDDFVAAELGIGTATLSERLSPEQVDAIGLIIDRLQSGRGFILGDETGIGKGRIVASTAAWAARQGKPIVFVTDRANLFSDLARDLIDIGEWERFRPLITNSDGKILNIMSDGEVIAEPPTAAQLRKLMAIDKDELPHNIIFTTYSQISGENSDKAEWLNRLSEDAMLILDEAHIAAGSDSNTAKQIQAMAENAWGVVYSSATWAKSFKNLHIYNRALPDSVNITQVTTAMRDEGESFGEVFSSMLAMDGAFIRREHDLSKIDFVMDVDDVYIERNREIAGKVSEILGMMAMISGEINHMLQRMSAETRSALQEAKEARNQIGSAIRSEQNSLSQEIARHEAAIVHATNEIETLTTELYNLQGRAREEEEIDQDLLPGPAERVQNEISQLSQIGPLLPNQSQRLTVLRVAAQIHDRIATREHHTQALDALRAQGGENRPAQPATKTKMFSSSFGTGGAIYQVMRRTIAALTVDYTADQMIKAAERGEKPVAVLEETGETFVRQLIHDEIDRIQADIKAMRKREAAGELTENDQTIREIAEMLDAGIKPAEVVRRVRAPNIQDMLRQLVSRLGGVRIVESNPSNDDTDKGEIVTVAQSHLLDLPGVDETVTEKYLKGIEEINEKINQLPLLPLIPFDALRTRLEKAGLSVTEISGRQMALHPVDEELGVHGPLELVKRSRKKSDVTQDAARFNAGKSDVMLINRSAATGLSLHSSPRFADTRQRHLFEVQSPEDPATRTQLFGRVNRFDQVIWPKFSFMNSGLLTEMRAMITANKKLQKLSANVRASRQNAAVIEEVPDLLNRTGDRVCQEYLLENPGVASRLDIPIEKIKDGYGMANMVTQRLALLGLKEYEQVWSGLCEAYEDAIISDKISMTSDRIELHDWRARMVSQRHAWGPSDHIEALSAFDSPVYERIVEYTYNYQPVHWDEVRDRVRESTQLLLQDERIKPKQAETIGQTQQFISMQRRSEEARLSELQAKELFAKGLFESMVLSLPAESIGANLDELAQRRTATIDEEEVEAQNQSLDLNEPTIQVQNFKPLAGHWVAVEGRRAGAHDTERMMALVSRSGQTAKIWAPNSMGDVTVYLVDLIKLADLNARNQPIHGQFKVVQTLSGITEESWIRKRFNKVWGSNDPEITIVDMQAVVDRGIRMLEAKKIMGLQQTGFASIEDALASPTHNAVKEAHARAHFMSNVIRKLVPGTEFTISKKRFSTDFFGTDKLTVVDVTVPQPPHEGTLSKWKFHLASPGKEEFITMSGAVLLKTVGHDSDNDIFINGNIFEAFPIDVELRKQSFDLHRKGNRTVRKTLLVGNMFQAGEWARASKRGRPILYTDESGQTHRAVEVTGNTAFNQAHIEFPLRLHNADMIKEFMNAMFSPAQVESARHDRAVVTHTSFRGALEDTGKRDTLVLDPHTNCLAWVIDKGERERIRRSVRNAVKADQRRWNEEHPDTPYPVKYTTASPRTSERYASMIFKLPDTPVGRSRFFDLFIKAQGLELFINRADRVAYEAASRAERKYYEKLAQPALEEQARKREIMQRRQAQQQMMKTAFGEKDSKVQSQKALDHEPMSSPVGQAEPTNHSCAQTLIRDQEGANIIDEATVRQNTRRFTQAIQS